MASGKSMTRFDLRIDNARVYDGSGTPAFTGSIAVRDGRIAAIGEVDGNAREVIDAQGAAVSPGFVDIHTHYDVQVFWEPELAPSSLNGVTTVLGGNCGFSIAPLNGVAEDAAYLMRMLARVEGMPLESLQAGAGWDWRGFGDYLARIEGSLAVNAAFMVGHSALRRHVMGARAVGERATPEDLDRMCALLRESLAAGGMGLSTSIGPAHSDGEGNPVPSRHASEEELVRLAAVVSEFEGTTLELLPDASRDFSEPLMSLMTRMSLAAQRPLNWNLLRPDIKTAEMNRQQLSACDYAAARGARIVPLVAALVDTMWLNFENGFVIDTLPGWTELFRLPPEERLRELGKPEVRQRMRDGAVSADAGARVKYADWPHWTFAEVQSAEYKRYQGMRVGEAARAAGRDPLDLILDVVVADRLKTSIMPPLFGTDEASWQLRGEFWRDSRTVIGASDAGAHLDMIDAFASAVKLLSEGVRERGLMTWEEAVRQLTAVPAELVGLRGRGRLAVGYHADIVIFDPATVGCGPVYTKRDLPAGAARLRADAIGISHVIVNGTVIARDGRHTGQRPGKLLRSGADSCTVHLPMRSVADAAQ
jgi:N-acyl-D-aspartate/D-glutamate deacylase